MWFACLWNGYSSQFHHLLSGACPERASQISAAAPLQTSRAIWDVNVCVRAGQVQWVTSESGSVTLSLYDCFANGPAGSSAPLDGFDWLKWVSFRVKIWSHKTPCVKLRRKALKKQNEVKRFIKWRYKIVMLKVEEHPLKRDNCFIRKTLK